MSFGEAVSECFSRYATFSGRARRSEFWWFYLFTFLLVLALSVVDALLGSSPVVSTLGLLVVVLPLLAAVVRRLHDTGRSGWYFLVGFIPFVGGIILILLMCGDSEEDNDFGPSPKYDAAPTYRGGHGR